MVESVVKVNLKLNKIFTVRRHRKTQTDANCPLNES